MRIVDISSLLWGDIETVAAVAGNQVLTRELFRVEAPMPCVWRINATNQSIGNAGVSAQLHLRVGIGRINQQLSFFVPNITVFSIELAAETLSAFFQTTAPAVATENWVFMAMVAPVVPWKGLEVKVVR